MTFQLLTLNRITFGLLCLAAAGVLLAVLAVGRLREWKRHRRHPDLRQRGGGSAYSGSRRSRGGRRALPYSGLGSYKGSRRRRSGAGRALFQPPSYKGKRR
jgi:hypothetical protein